MPVSRSSHPVTSATSVTASAVTAPESPHRATSPSEPHGSETSGTPVVREATAGAFGGRPRAPLAAGVDPQQLAERAQQQVLEAAGMLRRRWQYTPRVAVILGSGLGDLAVRLAADDAIPYTQIPNFPSCTALGHSGTLRLGLLAGEPIAVLQGRWHLYEGHAPQQLTIPIRALHTWGVRTLITTSAAGGLNPAFRCGELVLIRDHMNLLWRNPLQGPQPACYGPRWPDMSDPYDPSLRRLAAEVARRLNIPLPEGVYAALTGPNYETRAEYRMLRKLGADLVGMSTVPEVLTAVPLKLRVLSFSIVTNVCQPDALGTTSGEEVLDVAQHSAPLLGELLAELIREIGDRAWEEAES